MQERIARLLEELSSSQAIEEPFVSDYARGLEDAVTEWAEENAPAHTEFSFA